MYTMIIEIEHDAHVNDDHPFDFQGPLAEVEQVPAQFAAFLEILVFILNYRMIYLSICGLGEEIPHDSLQFIFILV
jgi:hypothetical protein